jgi:serine-type D-Ala-D-Ala carboxypeptidase (penicillin-binding protein 5/6)
MTVRKPPPSRRPQKRRGRAVIWATAVLVVAIVAVSLATGAFTTSTTGLNTPPPQAQVKPSPPPPFVPTPNMPADTQHSIHMLFPTPPRAGLVFDLDHHTALWRYNDFDPVPIASLTKLMTALVVVEHTQPGDQVQIPPEALAVGGSSVPLQTKAGQPVPVSTLMDAMLIPSANDAAMALAIHVGGSKEQFVNMMNDRAHQLGLNCTHFVSPDGLEPDNRSCAADLGAMAEMAMSNPRISSVVKESHASIPYPNRMGRLSLVTTNPLLLNNYPGTIGLKTGTTDEAGHTYIGVATHNSHTLGVVLLGSTNRYQQARDLLNAGFAAEENQTTLPH